MIGWRSHPSTQEEVKPQGFDGFELRLGDLMRGERATLSKSLLDVQRELKIKASYIAAIENCDVAAFDTPGFIAGFVRSYARYLGMDPEWAFQRFCDEAGFTPSHGLAPNRPGDAKPATPKPTAKPAGKAAASAADSVFGKLPFGKAAPKASPKPGAKPGADFRGDPLANPNALFVPRGRGFSTQIQPGAIGSVLVLAALIGAIGYGGWSVLQEVQKVRLAPVDSAPVVAEIDPLDGARALTGPDPVAAASLDLPRPDALDRLYRPEALDVPVLVARDGPISAIDPGSVGMLAGLGEASPAQAAGAGDGAIGQGIDLALAEALGAGPNQGQAGGQAAAEPGGVRTMAENAPELAIVAVRPSWVRVSAADGSVLFEKILDSGERYVVPAMAEAPVLRAGNSGSVYFEVKGQAYGPASPGSQVVKNLKLAASDLLGKYQPADLSKDPDLAKIVALAQAQIPGAVVAE